jgi:hypothetical protein
MQQVDVFLSSMFPNKNKKFDDPNFSFIKMHRAYLRTYISFSFPCGLSGTRTFYQSLCVSNVTQKVVRMAKLNGNLKLKVEKFLYDDGV